MNIEDFNYYLDLYMQLGADYENAFNLALDIIY